MTRTLKLFIFAVGLLILPASVSAQSSYSCDCGYNAYNCTDFANPAEAQSCFWYCGAQGAGDIHQLDMDMNAVACDTLYTEPVAVAPVTPTLEPVFYVEPIVTPTPEPVYVMPTAVPAYEVCACGGDYYDCSTFSGPSHAQGCYDYCDAKGLGDVHLMDPDGDGFACLVSGGASAMTVIPVAPTMTPVPYVPPTMVPVFTATPEPVYVAPTMTSMPTTIPTVYVPPTAVPIPTATPVPYIPGLDVNGLVTNAVSCDCSGDNYNCTSFSSKDDAVACFTHCNVNGYGDIHRLDQGGTPDQICEHIWPSAPVVVFEVIETSSSATCDCSRDAYNCSDGSFRTQSEAQACFDYCYDAVGFDVHRLDADQDFYVCERL